MDLRRDTESVSSAGPCTSRVGSYVLSDDPERLDPGVIHDFLRRAYWCEDIPAEVVERAIRGSLCIGAYDESGGQVGLVRLISDYATFCYVCDVFVLDEHRGQGLSKAMMHMAMTHPMLQGLRRWHLLTRDAHGLYGQFGFTPTAHPERHMERTDPLVYRRG